MHARIGRELAGIAAFSHKAPDEAFSEARPLVCVADTFIMVCIMRIVNSVDLIRELMQAGWMLDRVRGSHHVFTKLGHRSIVVPHPRKDLGRGLIAAIRRQAGL